MNISHHGSDVSAGVFLLLLALHVLQGGGVPHLPVALVQGVDLALLRDGHVLLHPEELTLAGLEHEPVDGTVQGQHHHRGRAVEGVAGGHQVATGLEGGLCSQGT